MQLVEVQDYLQTQGLRLSAAEVQVAYLALQTVIDRGEASIDKEVLWYRNQEICLAEHIEQTDEHEILLKQVFMALDSVFSRQAGRSAVVYALMADESPYLIRLAQQGDVVEQYLPVNEESGWTYLASRSAQTGWLNMVEDVAEWLALGELKGKHHDRNRSQMSLPICHRNGGVLGVLHIEYAESKAFNEEVQTEWVALALALAEPLQALLHYMMPQERVEDESVD